ncbi:hypothetical protein LCGC14_2353600 [marine sediment metagenome]|uniref:Uncharacterized protein n=1 Tax=marine sediment metagenome TaxID=412755 RepID=A0A0F9F3D0_9ZZZZ
MSISLKSPVILLITVLLFITTSLSGIFFAWYLSIYREERDCNWCKDLFKFLFLSLIVAFLDAVISTIITESF